jgi:replication-associated recombination protein RarA
MLLHKYTPQLGDFKRRDIIEHILQCHPIRMLIMGNGGVGKTCLANLIAAESGAEVFRVSTLDHCMTFIRTDVRTFCTTVRDRRKMLLIDNIDLIPVHGQHLLLKYVPPDMHFVTTATHRHSVCESIHSTIVPFYIDPFTKEDLVKIMDRMLVAEGRVLPPDIKERLIDFSNLSCRRMINLVQKTMLLPSPTLSAVDEACVHISCIADVVDLILADDVHAALSHIVHVHKDGYTVLDILYAITNYIPMAALDERVKYEWVKVCCKYIAIYYERHEHPIELAFLVDDLRA